MADARLATRDNSGKLFNHLMQVFDLKNDAALARWLEVAPPVISKIRHGRLTVGAGMKINIHEKTDMLIKTINALIAG